MTFGWFINQCGVTTSQPCDETDFEADGDWSTRAGPSSLTATCSPAQAQPIAYYKYLPFVYFYFSPEIYSDLFVYLFRLIPPSDYLSTADKLRHSIDLETNTRFLASSSCSRFSLSLSLSRVSLRIIELVFRDCWSELRFDWFESSFSTVIERFALRLCIFDRVMRFPNPIADFGSAFWWLFAGWLWGRIERSFKEMDDREGSFVAVRRISQGLERGSVYNSSSGKIWSLKRFVEMNAYLLVTDESSYALIILPDFSSNTV